jgi:ornithine carbamoyltransferase
VDADTSAILVETIQGDGGINPCTPEFLVGLRRLCDERGLLLMLDEVQCGAGRTGRFFAFEHAGIRPDAIAMAKGLGGGFPIGAMWVGERAADLFQPGSHGSTFGGTPLACAAALAVLDVIEREGLLAHVSRESVPWIRELGLLAGTSRGTCSRSAASASWSASQMASDSAPYAAALRERGLLTAPRGPMSSGSCRPSTPRRRSSPARSPSSGTCSRRADGAAAGPLSSRRPPAVPLGVSASLDEALPKETDLTPAEAGEVFSLAREFKRTRGRGSAPALAGQTWALIFSKSSTRTRVSFEVGIHELGGHPIFLNRGDLQLGRGESIEDTARVLSRFVHGIVIRTFEQSDVERLAAAGSVPVVNGLTDFLHPCQIYADAFTAAERWAGPDGDLVAALRGRKIAFLGDTSFNMANSWILGASLFGMRISLAGPKGFEPGAQIRAQLRAEGRAADFSLHGRSPRGRLGRRHCLHGRLDQHGPGGGGRAQGRADAPLRRHGRRLRRGEARRPFHALPARPSGRGGRAGRARQPALGGLRRGREPAPRAEGDPRGPRSQVRHK